MHSIINWFTEDWTHLLPIGLLFAVVAIPVGWFLAVIYAIVKEAPSSGQIGHLLDKEQ